MGRYFEVADGSAVLRKFGRESACYRGCGDCCHVLFLLCATYFPVPTARIGESLWPQCLGIFVNLVVEQVLCPSYWSMNIL